MRVLQPFFGSIVLLLASHAFAQITIDGDPSDWSGVAPGQVHATAISSGEWIYKGDVGDYRGDAGANPNFDLTEVRVRRDSTYLFFLFRFADITSTNEVHLGVGIDKDRSAADSNGLNFLGDDSGLGFPSGANHPEYQLSIHNTGAPATQVEFFHDAGGGTWFNNDQTENIAWISAANDVVEARVLLTSVELTPASQFALTVVTFDNGTTANPGGLAFNNTDDTTVDYPVHDALDGMGGTAGTSANAFTRVFNGGGTIGEQPGTAAAIDLANVASVHDWTVAGE